MAKRTGTALANEYNDAVQCSVFAACENKALKTEQIEKHNLPHGVGSKNALQSTYTLEGAF
jgi:hypothetical protein